MLEPLADPDSPIEGEGKPPHPSLSLSLLFPFHFPPLRSRPLKYSYGLGSAVSSPSVVWGRAPAEIEFGEF